MRIGLTIGCVLLAIDAAWSAAAESQPIDPKRAINVAEAQAVLRGAAEIVMRQGQDEQLWTGRALAQIASVQIEARDFDGALRSIRGSDDSYKRNAAIVTLAEALAVNGHREKALEILGLLDADHGWNQAYLDDGVQLRWIEHLLASGDRERAAAAVEQLKSDHHRPDGLRMLGAAYAKAGDGARATEFFTRSIAASDRSTDDHDRARSLWETAEAQRAAGKLDAARETIRRLVDVIELKDAWARVSALREGAVVTAKIGDKELAGRLFQRAIDAVKGVNAMNTFNALETIATAQARVGFVAEAQQTTGSIRHGEQDFTQDGKREAALYEIAVAQLKAGDPEAALRTTETVKHFLQYRDDGIREIVAYHIAKRDFTTALAAAGKVGNPSRRATAILRVAAAHAKVGDRKTAAEIAAKIELTGEEGVGLLGEQRRFDYRIPRTWGLTYDIGTAMTSASLNRANRCAAEVATAAMTLALELGLKPADSYAVSFDDLDTDEVVEALARTQAAYGAVDEALAWARQVGRDDKIMPGDDLQARCGVERRVFALLGVAKGTFQHSNAIRPGDAP